MLALTFLVFFMLSGGLFYASRGVVRENLYKECANASSDLHKADILYQAANAKLCSAVCPCKADVSLWRDYNKQQADNAAATNPSATAQSAKTNPVGAATNTGMNTATTSANVA